VPPAPSPVLAIGIDAAEAQLLRRLAGEGRLPAISALASVSGWGTVQSSAAIGSGSVWPTFMTGHLPHVHGCFGEYGWDPARMTLVREAHGHLRPFWIDLAAAGHTVAVVDVPFAPVVGREHLIEVANWGAHDWWGDNLQVLPSSIGESLRDVLARPHPLAAGPVDSSGPDDVAGLRSVAQACREGAALRGDLALRILDIASPDLLLVVFPELHRASHLLWHTIDPSHPAWAEGIGPLPGDVTRGLEDIVVAIDREVGRLVSHGNGARAVLVFSLHGMQPARGIPSFLGDVLERWGYAVRTPWWRRSARRHAGDLARAAKRAMPQSIKSAYYRRASRSLTRRLSQSSMPFPAWDWAGTRAFSIPSDQHGWVRVNLAGREACGVVRRTEYRAVCAEIGDRLLGLASREGPLVRDVLMTDAAAGGPPAPLPDLVVHWSPLTWRRKVQVLDPPLSTTPLGLKFVSQHADDGFFVGSGLAPGGWPPTVSATDLGVRIGRMLGRS
jgi:predicted AlkP superfamily phosphohydrolase/phosphomutase